MQKRRILSFAEHLSACSYQCAAYGRCVSKHAEDIRKGVCEKEFLELIACIRKKSKLSRSHPQLFICCTISNCGRWNILSGSFGKQELELLGGHFHGALLIAKQYKCLKCKHMVQKEKPCSASKCLQKLVGKENSKKYFIATQDKDLRADLNEKVAACPLLFLQQKVIHLDRLSQVCKEKADREIESKLNFESSKDTVAMLKSKLLPKSYSEKKDENFIRRKPKAPNPLSCLKKKKKNNVPRSDGKRTRRRRRRANKRGNNMNAVVQDASSCLQ
ncbi:rRNA-processing protein [Trichinella spiralis]|uniref:rRNA-processing protein n=1 Tax=Trichinella spiralis TaxID=6334 RepID=A0ABR3K3Y4_TRISP